MPPLLVGLALGGAAMYFFDPDRGRRRRALVRDKAVGATNCTRDFVNEGVRDLKNRGSAVTGRVKSMLSRRESDDRVLVERVRAVMGHYVDHPGAIEVDVRHGRVTLNGSILSHEHPELIEAAGSIPGVQDVVDQLAVYETAEGISKLQGGREPRRRGFANPQHWSPGAQLLAGAAIGLYLLLHSKKLRSLVYLAATGAALSRVTAHGELQALAGGQTTHTGAAHESNTARTPFEETA